jgi:hypothetical protein
MKGERGSEEGGEGMEREEGRGKGEGKGERKGGGKEGEGTRQNIVPKEEGEWRDGR